MKKKILIISYHYPPAGGASTPASLRIGKFAKYLPDLGWRPVVLSSKPDYYSIEDESLVFAPATKVIYVSNPIPGFSGKGRLSQWLPAPGFDFFWAKKIHHEALNAITEYQPRIIFCSSPPVSSLVAGYWLHLKTGLPLALDYRDQWTYFPYRSGPQFLKFWDKWLETKILKKAKLVIVSNQERRAEHIERWGSIGPQPIVIPNGFDPSDFDDIASDRIPWQDFPQSIKIRYMGQIYGPRRDILEDFLKSIGNALENNTVFTPIINFEFWGNQNLYLKYKNQNNRLNIKTLPAVQYKQSLSLELGADVLLLIIGKHTQNNAEVTSKIYEYFHSKRPIIVLGESDGLKKILQNSKQVFWVGSRMNSETLSALLNWLSGLPGDTLYYAPSNEFKKNIYSRRKASELLADALNKLLKEE